MLLKDLRRFKVDNFQKYIMMEKKNKKFSFFSYKVLYFKMKSNKFNFPINFVKENLIFNNKVCYAGFKLNGFEYSSCNNSEKN